MDIFKLIEKEQERQDTCVELIASENFVSDNILKALGSCLTNKYTEGYPGKRYYGGCDNYDELESYCIGIWQEVFKTDYVVNVQSHSGSSANLAAYYSVLKPGDKMLALDLNSGGHLTHGSSVNFSGKHYDVSFYALDENGYIDHEDLKTKLYEIQPKMVVAGASAYPRAIHFDKFSQIIEQYKKDTGNEVYFLVDMAHIAGLVATGYHQSPFGIADIITTTTHKTLRGPRGGMIFAKPELGAKINRAVFPGTQGGCLPNVLAAKALCAQEALSDDYKTYIEQVVKNSAAMAKEFINMGYDIVTGGTDNHLFLLDLTKLNISGKQAQETLDEYLITVNKNCIPCETRSPQEASGIRIGAAAMTTKGFKEEDFIKTAKRIDEILKKI